MAQRLEGKRPVLAVCTEWCSAAMMCKRLRLAVSTGSFPAVILFAMHVLTACK
jgi:hypothetical protein